MTASNWPLERALFATAGTVILISVALAAFVSPWFLIITALVGINQWIYVVFTACPASLAFKKFFGLRSALPTRSKSACCDAPAESNDLPGDRA